MFSDEMFEMFEDTIKLSLQFLLGGPWYGTITPSTRMMFGAGMFISSSILATPINQLCNIMLHNCHHLIATQGKAHESACRHDRISVGTST